MTEASKNNEDSLANIYFNIGLAALVVVLLALLRGEYGLRALLPVAIGVVGISTRLRYAPAVALGMLVAINIWRRSVSDFEIRWHRLEAADFALAAGFLTYTIMNFRLAGLGDGLLPEVAPRVPSKKSMERPVEFAEFGWLLCVVPLCGLCAHTAARLLSRINSYDDDSGPGAAQGRMLIWILVIGLLVARGLNSYIRWRGLSRAESLLVLQDIFWQETAGEQRLVSRRLLSAPAKGEST